VEKSAPRNPSHRPPEQRRINLTLFAPSPNTALVLTILKILPLAIYLRAAACKYNVPILGCDAPLCPVAIGKKGDCTPTANTAEIQARSIHWSPYDRVGVVNAVS
jgi:hypothetical protein